MSKATQDMLIRPLPVNVLQDLRKRSTSFGPHGNLPILAFPLSARRHGMSFHLSLQDPLHRYPALAIEFRVRIDAGDDDGAIGLDAGVEAAGLHVAPDRFIFSRRTRAPARRVPTRTSTSAVPTAIPTPLSIPSILPSADEPLQRTPNTNRPRNDGDLATERESGAARERIDGLLRREHADAVVHVDAEHEPGAEGVHEEARGRGPRPVGQAGDDDARAAGAGDVQAGAEGREDG